MCLDFDPPEPEIAEALPRIAPDTALKLQSGTEAAIMAIEPHAKWRTGVGTGPFETIPERTRRNRRAI
jgi:hypothetical protein